MGCRAVAAVNEAAPAGATVLPPLRRAACWHSSPAPPCCRLIPFIASRHYSASPRGPCSCPPARQLRGGFSRAAARVASLASHWRAPRARLSDASDPEGPPFGGVCSPAYAGQLRPPRASLGRQGVPRGCRGSTHSYSLRWIAIVCRSTMRNKASGEVNDIAIHMLSANSCSGQPHCNAVTWSSPTGFITGCVSRPAKDQPAAAADERRRSSAR